MVPGTVLGSYEIDVATNGTLVYVRGSATSRLPVWVDREGKEERIKAPSTQHQYLTPRLSPDGRHLAYHDITTAGRFLMVKTSTPDGSDGPTQIVVVQNWFEELRRLAPLK